MKIGKLSVCVYVSPYPLFYIYSHSFLYFSYESKAKTYKNKREKNMGGTHMCICFFIFFFMQFVKKKKTKKKSGTQTTLSCVRNQLFEYETLLTVPVFISLFSMAVDIYFTHTLLYACLYNVLTLRTHCCMLFGI